MFSFLRPLTTWHCSQLLLSAGRAAIDRHLLPTGPTAANPPHAAAAVDRWVRQTDGRTPYRYIDPAAYYAGSANSPAYVVVQNTTSKLTAPRNAIIHCSVIRSNHARQGKASGNCRNAMTIKRLRFPTIGRRWLQRNCLGEMASSSASVCCNGRHCAPESGVSCQTHRCKQEPCLPQLRVVHGLGWPKGWVEIFQFSLVLVFGLGPL